jgi:hypothetical protein
MKTKMRIVMISFVIGLVCFMPLGLSADPPGMPGNHGSNGDAPPGGGAPIGSGITLIIAMSAAYGSKKLYQFKGTE